MVAILHNNASQFRNPSFHTNPLHFLLCITDVIERRMVAFYKTNASLCFHFNFLIGGLRLSKRKEGNENTEQRNGSRDQKCGTDRLIQH